MKIISPTQHGYLDYITVVLFLIAPSLLGLTGTAGTIAYLLAGIHLAMTLVTDFPLGVVKKLPFTMHGWVERVVGPALVLLPFVLGFDGLAMGFYALVGIVIILVGLLTDYQWPQ
ncbi:MAG: hypothetical protein IPN42_10685 [Methylococcaceae bacterium]|nr:hypothetical protein [Methylococcaceae bacterium]